VKPKENPSCEDLARNVLFIGGNSTFRGFIATEHLYFLPVQNTHRRLVATII
jgi:hypothetical protein